MLTVTENELQCLLRILTSVIKVQDRFLGNRFLDFVMINLYGKFFYFSYRNSEFVSMQWIMNSENVTAYKTLYFRIKKWMHWDN
jgi:hypothetical protein